MTDAHLMDADCIHNVVWHECKQCGREPAAPGFTVGDCRIVGHVHRYLIECYRCPEWYAIHYSRRDAIEIAKMHLHAEGTQP